MSDFPYEHCQDEINDMRALGYGDTYNREDNGIVEIHEVYVTTVMQGAWFMPRLLIDYELDYCGYYTHLT